MPSSLNLSQLLPLVGKRRISHRLTEILAPYSVQRDDLFRIQAGAPYHVKVPSQGLDLLIQSLDAEAAPEQTDWALAGLSLHTGQSMGSSSAWPGPWLTGIDPESFNSSHAKAFFGADCVVAGQMVVAEMQSPEDAPWSLLSTYGFDGALQSLTILAVDTYAALHDETPQRVAAVSTHTIDGKGDVASTVSCGSRGRVPQTGWYEAHLPTSHPLFGYFSQIPGRFVRKHEGEMMLTLGVTPFADESLVRWTWLREG